jgi:MFS family permease
MAILPTAMQRGHRPSSDTSPRRTLPTAAAFYLLASIIVSFLAGSSTPTPLYPYYQAEWHFSPITTTVIFGVYAVAVLTCLLIVGSLSDFVGRRPVLLAAVVLQAAAMIVFASASGVSDLLIARVIQGLSIGTVTAAVGAGMLDLDRAKGTIANAVGPVAGVAAGAIGSSLIVQYLPAPSRTVYLVLSAICLMQAIGLVFMAESSPPKPGALASLRPQFAIPSNIRRQLFLGIPTLVAIWSLAGFYGSLGPGLIRLMVGSHSLLLGGLGLFTLMSAAAFAVLLSRDRNPLEVTLIGAAALLAGVGLTVIAITETSTVLFFIGTFVAGVGFGGGFQGAIRTVMPLAAPHERAGVLSIVYVVCYLAMGIPTVIAGYLVVHGTSLLNTARDYSLVIMVLAAIALVGAIYERHRVAVAAS